MGRSRNSDRFYFLGFQNHCGWWLQPCNLNILASWKESYSKPRHCIKKQRHHFANNCPYSKAMVFPVLILYGCDSWTIKKVARQRIDAFKLCWRRLLRVSWTARRSNQSVLKEISSEYSLGGLMLKLILQHFAHLMQRASSLETTKMLETIEGKRRQRAEHEIVRYHPWLNGYEFEQTTGESGGQRSLACCSSQGCKESDTTQWLNNSNESLSWLLKYA